MLSEVFSSFILLVRGPWFAPGYALTALEDPVTSSHSVVPSLLASEFSKKKKKAPAGTRTQNLMLRRHTPYPLGHKSGRLPGDV